MPDWITDLTVGEIGIGVGVIVVLFGGGYRLWKLFKPLEEFLTAWNGTPEKQDGAGIVIKPKVPGVIAQIEVLRDQLQNSHQDSDIPNLRDDLDTKASSDDVAAVREDVGKVLSKLDEHIGIAKESDRRQDITEKTLAEYLPKIRFLLGETDPPPATPPGGSLI